jgi:Kef-type K+ transport system membrane component KefB
MEPAILHVAPDLTAFAAGALVAKIERIEKRIKNRFIKHPVSDLEIEQ